jgi:hypothetical protein
MIRAACAFWAPKQQQKVVVVKMKQRICRENVGCDKEK